MLLLDPWPANMSGTSSRNVGGARPAIPDVSKIEREAEWKYGKITFETWHKDYEILTLQDSKRRKTVYLT